MYVTYVFVTLTTFRFVASILQQGAESRPPPQIVTYGHGFYFFLFLPFLNVVKIFFHLYVVKLFKFVYVLLIHYSFISIGE